MSKLHQSELQQLKDNLSSATQLHHQELQKLREGNVASVNALNQQIKQLLTDHESELNQKQFEHMSAIDCINKEKDA